MTVIAKMRVVVIAGVLLVGGTVAVASATSICGLSAVSSSPVTGAQSFGDAAQSEDFDLARILMRPAAGCVCHGLIQSNNYIFAGANCKIVGAGIFGLADQEAKNNCQDGVCFEGSVNYTVPCQLQPNGTWKGEGYINYICRFCT